MSGSSKSRQATKSLSRAERNKRDREYMERKAKGRILAFAIAAAREELQRIGIGKAQSNRKHEREAKQCEDEIANAEAELKKFGFDVESTVSDAIKYRQHLSEEDRKPQPVTSGGVGVYRLGNQKKLWT